MSLRLIVRVVSHGLGQCAVIGGFVYRGARYPGFNGRHFYADYCSGQIPTFDVNKAPAPQQAIDGKSQISAFAEDSHGELHVLA